MADPARTGPLEPSTLEADGAPSQDGALFLLTRWLDSQLSQTSGRMAEAGLLPPSSIGPTGIGSTPPSVCSSPLKPSFLSRASSTTRLWSSGDMRGGGGTLRAPPTSRFWC